MSDQDIRWKQRFANYRKANALLHRIAAINPLSETEQMGLIQAFEVTLELGWKLIQDYSIQVKNPAKNARDASILRNAS